MKQLKIIAIFSLLAVAGVAAAAPFVDNPSNPPANNTDEPINVSSATQVKDGTLYTGGFGVLSGSGLRLPLAPAVAGGSNAVGSVLTLMNAATGEAKWQPSSGGGFWEAVTGGINYAGGNVGVGSATPADKLDVNGNIWGRGADFKLGGSGAVTLHRGVEGSTATLHINPSAGFDQVYVNANTAKPITLHGPTTIRDNNLIVGGASPASLVTQHVDGKAANSTSAGDLFLNWNNSKDVYVGGGSANNADLIVSDEIFNKGVNFRLGATNGRALHRDSSANLHINPFGEFNDVIFNQNVAKNVVIASGSNLCLGGECRNSWSGVGGGGGTGVTSIIAGPGITTSSPTGAVTISAPSEFPAGTKLIFMTDCPAGWTRDNNENARFLIVSDNNTASGYYKPVGTRTGNPRYGVDYSMTRDADGIGATGIQFLPPFNTGVAVMINGLIPLTGYSPVALGAHSHQAPSVAVNICTKN